MNSSKNENVQKFLDHIEIMDNEKFDILCQARAIFLNTYQKVDEKIMYGGIVFFFNSEMLSGLFVNKDHVTFEFSRGFLMKDPDKRLEGKGKYRRHLKLRTKGDILTKEVESFVEQAL